MGRSDSLNLLTSRQCTGAAAILESNFHDYPLVRMNTSLEIDVVIVDSGTEPTGAGEPGLPTIAPAVANVVFRATG